MTGQAMLDAAAGDGRGTRPAAPSPRIAVLVPCHNEALTVAAVVRDFRAALPGAVVYVYDNNSTDGTADVAREAGAVVRHEPRQGKGNVVRRMFADVDADVYLMVDGDATYDAAAAPDLVAALLAGPFDMVNGARVARSTDAYRPGHRLGNKVLTGLVRHIFGTATTDMLSGYKCLSRRYVKSFPAASHGFEIETELTVHALELRMGVGEVPTVYGERPEGSSSKLRTVRDAIRILRLIGLLVKEERPLPFFGGVALLLAVVSVVLGAPVVLEFLETGLVLRLPTAVLATGLMLSGLLSLACGVILDSVARGRREMKRLHFLSIGIG
jgi:glycosyltransferase involved in cell wall biosynthesis